MPAKPKKIELAALARDPDLKGSVQDIYKLTLGGEKYIVCRTTKSGSVFDVGTIFSVPESDVLRTAVRHYIYLALQNPETWRQLRDEDFRACYQNPDICKDLAESKLFATIKKSGLVTHHVGMVDDKTGAVYADKLPLTPSNLVLIEEFPIYHPKRFSLWGRHGWDYHEYFRAPKKVIALEHVFRLGNPGGSSLQSRYNAAKKEGADQARKFLAAVGLTGELKPWSKFPDMIYDCTTKYEPQDRYLSWQETVNLAGVSAPVFQEVVRTIVFCTIYVYKFFAQMGFTLWDVKWEVAVDGDRVVLVDTIDPDSIRVTGSVDYEGRRCFVHFNKQSIRDYYKIIKADWYQAINDAKKRAESDAQGRAFMELYRAGVAAKTYPPIPEYDEKFGKLQSRKYALMVEPLINPSALPQLPAKAAELMREEISYYREAGKLDLFMKENALA